MRITRRSGGTEEYWNRRWTNVSVDEPMSAQRYPLEQSLEVIRRGDRVLEAGCGAGRLLRYFHAQGFDIEGFDFVDVAVNKLVQADPSLQVRQADIRDLPFQSGQFNVVLAFGLYHGISEGIDKALAETRRVLAPGGLLVASFRADNLQNRINDGLKDRARRKAGEPGGTEFHKVNLTREEIQDLLAGTGFATKKITPVVNMPLLFHFRVFRSRRQKVFDESLARRNGYELNSLGRALNALLMKFNPRQFCNLYAVVAGDVRGENW